MKKNNLKRFLASLLAVLMLASVTGVSPAVFADWGSNVSLTAAKATDKRLELNGDKEIRIPYKDNGDIDFDALYPLIFETCVDKSKSALQSYDKSKIDIEQQQKVCHKLEGDITCEPIKEDQTYTIKFTYHYGSLAWDKTEKSCKITFLGREAVPEIANKNITVDASFKEDLSIDYDALRNAIWDQVSVGLPTNVKFDKVSFEYKYNDTLNWWGAFEGKDIIGDKGIPALGLGTNQVKLTWSGDKEYKSWEQEITVNVVDGRTDTSITFVDDPTVKIPYNEDISVDMSTLTKNIWAIVDTITPNDISRDKITVLFDGKALDKANITEGSHTLTFKYAGTQTYKNFSTDVTVDFVGRENSTIVLKENASITYNMSGSVEKDAIIANVIDYTNSTLPADAKFTVEVPSIVDTSIVTIWKDITDNTMDAGENQKIRISFAGNAEYKPCNIVTTITVNRAPVSITLPIISKLYAGNEVDPETYYEVNPKDPAIDVYIFFIGINSNGESCVNVKLTPTQEKIIKAIPGGVYDTLRNGMKLSEFKEFIAKFDQIEFIGNILDILKTFDNITDNTVIALGTPIHAGVYQAIATSPETKNYEAGKGTGSLVILKNWKGIKIEKNPDIFEGSEITESEAKAIAEGNESLCILTQDGKPLNSASAGSIHYWFTGVNRIHVGSKMPTAPGKYIVTASVRGGDFFALPKTFSFTIVNDPAPEA